ncbi:hypothetical protein HDU98_008617, partial [Podochytrium sp. JEL0797]
ALVTWNSRHGDIILHPYSTPTSTPIHSFVAEGNLGQSQPPRSSFKPQRLPPFHLHDPLFSNLLGDATFRKPSARINLFHPEEPSWATERRTKKKGKRQGLSASDDDEEGVDGVGGARLAKEHARKHWDAKVPAWPGLAGVAMRESGGGTGVDLWQVSEEGVVYWQRLGVEGEEEWLEEESAVRVDQEWVEGAEKRALRNHEKAPFVKQVMREMDVTTYSKYTSKILLNPLPVTEIPFDLAGYSDISTSLLSTRQSKSLFELYEFSRKSHPIQYNSAGHPTLLHPRPATALLHAETVETVIDACNSELATGPSTSEFMDMDTLPLDESEDVILPTNISEHVQVRKIRLDFLDMFGAEGGGSVSDYSLESVRIMLEAEFSKDKLYPRWPDIDSEPVDAESSNPAQTAALNDLERLSDLSRATSLDWIARDLFLSCNIIEGVHSTETTQPIEPVTTDTTQVKATDDDEYEDLDATVKILLEDRELNLPATATIHNPLMLRNAYSLSKESILLRDKWNNPGQWYGDDYEATRRMNQQVSLQTWSKREEATGPAEESGGGEFAENARKRKSGRATMTQEDVVKAIERESSIGSSQIRVVSHSQSQRASQSFPVSQPGGRPSGGFGRVAGGLGSSQQIGTPARVRAVGVSQLQQSPSVRSENGSQLLQPTPMLGRSSLGGSLLPGRMSMGGSQLSRMSLGGSQLSRMSMGGSQGAGSQSQPVKKKPRKSGF